MYKIEYILVNDSTAKGSACESFHRCVPGFGYCIVCDAEPEFLDEPSGKTERKIHGSKEHAKLLDELCRLRRKWPEAKILGVSELDTSSKHATIRVNPEMNALRRELSNLP